MFQHTDTSSGHLIYKPKTSSFRRRILEVDGRLNVYLKQIPNKHLRYAKDLGNTLINIRWRWILLTLTIVNSLAWLAFAFAWMSLAWHNGDFGKSDSEPDVCIVGTRHFTGYLLLSIETLTTIGFGVIYPGDCPTSGIVLMLQALAGVAIEGALVTAVYVKMSRPIKYVNGLFSSKAIICLREGRLCLVFRIYDESGRYWTQSKIKAFLIGPKDVQHSHGAGKEEFYMWKLQLEPCELLAGPVDVVHIITNRSPLWTFTAGDFLSERFEIVLTVNGDSATTGQPSEAKKSYANCDILWGCRYVHCMHYDETLSSYVVDFNRFNSTIMCETPLCSAADLDQLINEIEHHSNDASTEDKRTTDESSEIYIKNAK